MKSKKYPTITKARSESFGAIIFSEHPAFMAQVNEVYANKFKIAKSVITSETSGIFSAPLDVHFAITTRCNMYCKGCYSTGKQDSQKDISLEKAKLVIDKLAELNVFSLAFGGGEPTLHSNIIEIAEYARERQILPNMTTNGLTMTSDFASKCSVFGNVHFSIHKLEDTKHIFKAIQTYKKMTKKKAGINLLLTPSIMTHLNDIVSQAKKYKVDKILFLRYKTTAKNKHVQGLSMDSELEKLPAILKDLQLKNKSILFLSDCSMFELLAENDLLTTTALYKYDNNGCLGANGYIAVDVDAMYKPCSFWHESFGSVFDLSFDFWQNDEKLNQFRQTYKKRACLLCDYLELCKGGCRLRFTESSVNI